MLISTAYAQGVGGLFDGSNAMVQFLPLVLIFVVFYFMLIRPQQKKQKDHRAMLDTLRRGDRVVTGGGIIGTVNRVAHDGRRLLVLTEREAERPPFGDDRFGAGPDGAEGFECDIDVLKGFALGGEEMVCKRV